MALMGELRRRNIFKVSLAYAIVSWLVTQIADVILPIFHAPDWIMQVLVLFLVLGFPIAVLLAWAYELTPDGLKPSSDVDRSQSITAKTGQKLNYVVISLLAIAVTFMVIDNYVFTDLGDSEFDVGYRRSIAVIPFMNRSATEENAEFLTDGIHDELLTRLAQIADLRVVSRTSVMEYRNTTRNIRQIGEELGVGSILEGGVQRDGDELRINVQLIDALTDEHIWAQTYDRGLSASNLFAIQSEMSASIADQLKATLTDEEQQRIDSVPTESMPALEAYFAGKQAVNLRGTKSLQLAIEHFEHAVDIDPQFSLAWAGLAEAWLELPNYIADTDPARVRLRSSAAANRAIALDPGSPTAAAVLGWHQLLHDYDWSGAEKSFQLALATDATNVNALHWYSHLMSWQGRHEEAIVAAEKALAIDPLSRLMATNYSYILADAGKWDKAFEIGDRTLKDDPFVSLMGDLWIGKMRARRPEAAAAQLLRWANVTGRSNDAAIDLGELLVEAQTNGTSVKVSDDLIVRLQIATEVPEIYAAIGDRENTIASLQNAHRTGTGFRSLLSMRINPSYDFIRDDPRFIELLAKIGLAE